MIAPVYAASESRYQSGMKYRRCGKSGILLPEIALGLWHNFGDVDTLAHSRQILQTAELLYGHGHKIIRFNHSRGMTV